MVPALGGFRVVRLSTEKRCKCCGTIRDAVERWLLMRHVGQHEADGSRVSMPWMVKESEKRLGIYVSDSSFKSHLKNHIEIVRDTTVDQLVMSEQERIREAAREIADRDEDNEAWARARGEEPEDEHQAHLKLLEEVVRQGRAIIEAEPGRVTVDHALTAAKELARLKQDESRDKLLAALARAGGVRVGPAEVQRELPEPAEDVEDAEVVEA